MVVRNSKIYSESRGWHLATFKVNLCFIQLILVVKYDLKDLEIKYKSEGIYYVDGNGRYQIKMQDPIGKKALIVITLFYTRVYLLYSYGKNDKRI